MTLYTFLSRLLRECGICFERMRGKLVYEYSACGASYCETCMQSYIESKVQNGLVSSHYLVFPAADCSRALQTLRRSRNTRCSLRTRPSASGSVHAKAAVSLWTSRFIHCIAVARVLLVKRNCACAAGISSTGSPSAAALNLSFGNRPRSCARLCARAQAARSRLKRMAAATT